MRALIKEARKAGKEACAWTIVSVTTARRESIQTRLEDGLGFSTKPRLRIFDDHATEAIDSGMVREKEQWWRVLRVEKRTI